MTLMLLVWRVLTSPGGKFPLNSDEMWFYYEPALIASALLLPLVIMDMHPLHQPDDRTVGTACGGRCGHWPAARMSNPSSSAAATIWQEIADEFNAVRASSAGLRDRSPKAARRNREEEEPVAVG